MTFINQENKFIFSIKTCNNNKKEFKNNDKSKMTNEVFI